jgi:hypothetical protein
VVALAARIVCAGFIGNLGWSETCWATCSAANELAAGRRCCAIVELAAHGWCGSGVSVAMQKCGWGEVHEVHL